MIAFRLKSKRKNNTIQRQKNYCYVCVARMIAAMKSPPGVALPAGFDFNLTKLRLTTEDGD